MIANLLNDLLDVSRISQGKIELKRQLVDLRSLLPTVRETTLPEVTRHQSDVIFQTPDYPLWIEGDPARLVQVQVNLIHNAAKYSAAGSTIEVILHCEPPWVILNVKDQGVGITEEFLPKLFELFAQSDETLDRSEGGLGVGLTLVKTLVEMHGGNVEACSPGRNMGSTFTVRLPLAPEKTTRDLPKTVPGEANSDRLDARPNTTLAPLPEAAPRLHIVLVEDLDESRDIMKTILELEGHSVATAQDGENGCELILNGLPDVAIVDIGLPGISGYEVAKRVRSLLHDQVYMIALTGYGQQQDTQAALQSGFNAHLVKPAAMETLFEMLAKIPERSADKPHSTRPAVNNNRCEAQ